ncbi:MAG: HEAT repeat domain-containing protein [Elusimicrobia bacterium]|nr:HEAT repeat domain-containing protein [Elusimicrobiota bacterium]
MPRAFLLAGLALLASGRARGFEEASVADRNLPAILVQLETGNWNARIHAVHELDYMQEEGLAGLALATGDGDWQVRMTAVHALGARGTDGAPILNRLLKHEPCPVVRLMTLHSLGSLGPEGEEAKAMGWISDASTKDVNACQDQSGPGRAPWAQGARRGIVSVSGSPASIEAARPRKKPAPARVSNPAPPENAVVTRDPVPPAPSAAPAAKPARPKEDLPSPTKFQRRIELDALLDLSTAAVSRPGVALAMSGRGGGAPETLPWPVAPVPREHEVAAPGLIMKDAGGKAAHDALPGLLRALKQGDARTRARAADDLGHLGAKAAPAVPALIAALGDRSARVRASAGLSLGNIGTLHESVVPLLTKALKDRSEDVRYAAALALSRIDSPEARDAFNRHVGKEARRAIDRPRAPVNKQLFPETVRITE